MDWLQGMNEAVRYIESSLTEVISYEALAKTVRCSAYEFSRIFSFMTGVSLSEYIRRRRLSAAVFDIQKGDEKIIDVALKYCYESPSTFARAFKELHGVSPLAARKSGVPLVMYPPISFNLTIKGVSEMRFRLEKREEFNLVGECKYFDVEDTHDMYEPMIYNKRIEAEFPETVPINAPGDFGDLMLVDRENGIYEAEDGTQITLKLKGNFFGSDLFYSPPKTDTNTAVVCIIAAIDYHLHDGKVKKAFGLDESQLGDGMKFVGNVEHFFVPASDWAVFTVVSETEKDVMSQAYMRILTEWFPESSYKRDESKPHLEKHFLSGESKSKWEIWMPIIPKGDFATALKATSKNHHFAIGAKRSNPNPLPNRTFLDCFVATLLAMTGK